MFRSKSAPKALCTDLIELALPNMVAESTSFEEGGFSTPKKAASQCRWIIPLGRMDIRIPPEGPVIESGVRIDDIKSMPGGMAA